MTAEETVSARGRGLALEGVHNARDVGGIVTRDGRRVRTGRLFRSGHLDECSPAGLGQLTALGIRCVIDLRSLDNERLPTGARIADADTLVLNLPMAGDLAEIRRILMDPATGGFAGCYLSMLRRDEESVLAALRVVADNCHAPVWIHCTAGKDRTGILMALLLGLLGAGPEDIVEDYARTRIDPSVLHETVRRLGWEPDGTPSAVFRADPETMQGFLARFEESHGSPEQWALSRGLTQPQIDRLRRELLEDVGA